MFDVRYAAALAALAWAISSPSLAGPAPCPVPEPFARPGWSLSTVRAQIGAKQAIRIVVVGTASSTGMGLSAPDKVYPERLAFHLRAGLPGQSVELINRSKRGWSTAEMAKALPEIIREERPTLVVWQTGTVEAVRSIDVNEMGDALLAGVAALSKAKANVILMDPQYSPRTAALVDFRSYTKYMAWISQSTDAEYFRRYELMRAWVEAGAIAFDDIVTTAQQKTADRAHECIGRALAEMILDAVAPRQGDKGAMPTAAKK